MGDMALRTTPNWRAKSGESVGRQYCTAPSDIDTHACPTQRAESSDRIAAYMQLADYQRQPGMRTETHCEILGYFRKHFATALTMLSSLVLRQPTCWLKIASTHGQKQPRFCNFCSGCIASGSAKLAGSFWKKLGGNHLLRRAIAGVHDPLIWHIVGASTQVSASSEVNQLETLLLLCENDVCWLHIAVDQSGCVHSLHTRAMSVLSGLHTNWVMVVTAEEPRHSMLAASRCVLQQARKY